MRKKPTGSEIIALLVALLEDQEGVEITYVLEEGDAA